MNFDISLSKEIFYREIVFGFSANKKICFPHKHTSRAARDPTCIALGWACRACTSPAEECPNLSYCLYKNLFTFSEKKNNKHKDFCMRVIVDFFILTKKNATMNFLVFNPLPPFPSSSFSSFSFHRSLRFGRCPWWNPWRWNQACSQHP